MLRLKGATLRLKGSTVRLKGSTLRLKGSTVRLKGSTLRLKGLTVRLKSSMLRLKGSTARLKGSKMTWRLEIAATQTKPAYAGYKNFYIISIDDCNASWGKDAMNRVSTNGLFVAFFFQIGIRYKIW
jgi:hypothetical protein